MRPDLRLTQELGSAQMDLPRRKDAAGLGNASHVLSTPLQCYQNSPLELHGLKVWNLLCPKAPSHLGVSSLPEEGTGLAWQPQSKALLACLIAPQPLYLRRGGLTDGIAQRSLLPSFALLHLCSSHVCRRPLLGQLRRAEACIRPRLLRQSSLRPTPVAASALLRLLSTQHFQVRCSHISACAKCTR